MALWYIIPNPKAAQSVCDWILTRIKDKEPTSVIRLGDGEGNFLPYPPDLEHHQIPDQMMVQRDPWWGRELIQPPLTKKFTNDLIKTIANADLVGIPPAVRILIDLDLPTAINHRADRGIIAVFEHLSNTRIQGLKTSCNLHVDFERWNLYPRLLSGVREVSIISCHDLSNPMKNLFDIQIRSFHKIPGEFRHLSRFGYDRNEMGDAIFPDVFMAIMENIDPKPGEVYLVGAGILGKLFCNRIKELGGIGIDIGSQTDNWMNFNTRQYSGVLD